MKHHKHFMRANRMIGDELHLVDKNLLALMVVARYKHPDIKPEELVQLAEKSALIHKERILELAGEENNSLAILDRVIGEEIERKRQDRENLMLHMKKGETVAIIPFPPHVLEWFYLKDIHPIYLRMDRHPLPPHLRDLNLTDSLKDGILALKRSNCIVLEGYRDEKGTYFMPSFIAQAIFPHFPSNAKIVLHLRPHKHFEDDAVILDNAILEI